MPDAPRITWDLANTLACDFIQRFNLEIAKARQLAEPQATTANIVMGTCLALKSVLTMIETSYPTLPHELAVLRDAVNHTLDGAGVTTTFIAPTDPSRRAPDPFTH